MSLQNILVPNNYSIYANEFIVNDLIVADTLTAQKIITDEIEPNTNNDITFTGNIILPDSLSGDRQIGSSTSYFSNLWCERLQGTGAPVMVQNGITGENGTDALYVANNGLVFNNAAVVSPITNYTVDYYAEFSGTMTASVAIPDTVVNYTAVRIGSAVNFTFGFESQDALVAGSTSPILIQSLPADLRPIVPKIVVVPALRNGLYQPGGLLINTDGTMQLYGDTLLTLFFPVNGASGLYIPNGDVCCISYNIN